MQIKMTNPPSFLEVFTQTSGPKIFNRDTMDLTSAGESIVGAGILAMIGAYVAAGSTLIPASILVMGLTYIIMKVQTAYRIYTKIQSELQRLNTTNDNATQNTVVSRIETLWETAKFAQHDPTSNTWTEHTQSETYMG